MQDVKVGDMVKALYPNARWGEVALAPAGRTMERADGAPS